VSLSTRSRLTAPAITIALALSFTACLVADPGDYQRSDLTSTTGDPPVGNSTTEDGHVHP
jgi:hypothetical protein